LLIFFGSQVLKKLRYVVLSLLLLMGVGACAALITLRGSLPVLDGTGEIVGLSGAVTVTSDEYGIPTIVAASRLDALRALGYVTARDRFFQIDVLRRKTAGTLAEVIGAAGLESDIEQRRIGLSRAAHAILQHVPEEQRSALQAYAEGVNSYLRQADSLPFEFRLLRYRPSPWTMEDSILVVLSMFQTLNWSEEEERMRTVMASTLPPEVFTFLMPHSDRYTRALLNEEASGDPRAPIPVDALAALRKPTDVRQAQQAGLLRFTETSVGSNGWAVDGSKTVDGRAIVANDMHLDVAVPNIWYRAQWRYEDVEMTGLTLPGVPLLITGTNGAVAWGITNMEGDFLDLVRLDLNPTNADEYRTPDGWRRFETRTELIKVRGEDDVSLIVKSTIWGPLAERSLLGQPVAIHWTALDPTAVSVGLIDMDRPRTLEGALDVMNRARTPGSSVILADTRGRVGWTYAGNIPVRRGFDGATSLSWADGQVGWEGFIPPERLPRLVDPPSGFIVSANHRMLGKEYPHTIGHDFANGYRAYRITERLRDMSSITEADMLRLQLDTASEFYRFYQQLALQELTNSAITERPSLSEVREVLEVWNGRADVDSLGFGLIVRFRKALAKSVFAPFLWPCQAQDEKFSYGTDLDTPLQAMLTERMPQLLPDPVRYAGWGPFIVGVLDETVRQLKEDYGVRSLTELRWGRINRVRVSHPFASAFGLSALLDMPDDQLPGCGFCVRMASGTLSASERMVVSPGRAQDGILHMPGGQSGHPLSSHYRDQQGAWIQGRPLPFSPGEAVHTLRLVPSQAQKQAHSGSTMQEAA
jgi:penicillin G amidase